MLAQQLPEVFDLKQLPSHWDDEWIVVPVDNPDDLHSGQTDASDPLVELYGEDGQFEGTMNSHSRLPGEVSTGFSGSFCRDWDSAYPPPDAYAFYLPFHYFYPTWWGIYLIHEGVSAFADILAKHSGRALNRIEYMEAARIFLFGHEQFHHETESFATRLEVTHRVPLYQAGFEDLYRRTYLTDDCMEEALANAHGVRRVLKAFEHPQVKELLEHALASYMDGCPPGYRVGFQYVGKAQFEKGRRELAERAHKQALPHIKSASFSLWRSFPRAFHPFRTRNGRVNFLVHRNSPLAGRLELSGRYFRYKNVVRQLKKIAGCEFVRSNGSHIMSIQEFMRA